MLYSGKSLLLLKSLQGKLRAQGISGLSLQDPDIVSKITEHVMRIESEELRSLLFQLKTEMGEDIIGENNPTPTTEKLTPRPLP